MSTRISPQVQASETLLWVGVAVTQAWLETEVRDQKIVVYNDPDGWRYILRHLAESKHPLHVVCESAERWESGIASELQAAGIPISLAETKTVCELCGCASAEEISPAILASYGRMHGDMLELARPTKPIAALFPRVVVKARFWDGFPKRFAALFRRRSPRAKSPPSA